MMAKARGVTMTTSVGKILSIYESASEAARENGLTRQEVSNCCTKERKHARGKYFKYEVKG